MITTRKLPTATTKALLTLAQQPQARLLTVNDCCFLLDGNCKTHEHKYIPSQAFSILREKEWITPPQARGDQLAECTISELGKAAASSIQALQSQYTQLEFDLETIDNHMKSTQLALFDATQSPEETAAPAALIEVMPDQPEEEHESQHAPAFIETSNASTEVTDLEREQIENQTQPQEQTPVITLVDKVARYMPKRADVLKAIAFSIGETTPDQIARCHQVKREGQAPYYLVESEHIADYRYKVQYTAYGFTCTCTSGKEQFVHVYHQSRVCPHVRWSLAASLEARAAQDERVREESQEEQPAASPIITDEPQLSSQLAPEQVEGLQEPAPEEQEPQPAVQTQGLYNYIKQLCGHEYAAIYPGFTICHLSYEEWVASIAQRQCNTCIHEHAIQTFKEQSTRPWYEEFTPEVLVWYEQAVSIAATLQRPFTEREVLSRAWEEGYELALNCHPRFKRISSPCIDSLTGKLQGPTYVLLSDGEGQPEPTVTRSQGEHIQDQEYETPMLQEMPAQQSQAQTKYLTCAETAKIVRDELKNAFPSIKFSVRSRTYSMGASIDVKWTNGPTEADVQHIVKHYEGAAFDSSQDLKTYHENTYNGERVHFGADYIHTERLYSVKALQEVASAYCHQYSYTVPTVKQSSYDGSAYIPNEEDIILDTGRYLAQEVARAAAQVDMTPKPVREPEQKERKEPERKRDEEPQPPTARKHTTEAKTESPSPIQFEGQPIELEVLDILKACDVDGSSVTLPRQLDRKLYLKVNDTLERIGGKWNRKAKTHLFEDDPRALFYWMLETGTQPPKNPTSYFPTSAHIAERMTAAIPATAKRILEPSAGTGNIARAIRDYCVYQKIDMQLDCCELVTTFQEKLKDQGFSIVASDFLQYQPDYGYDAIVMNPPFSLESDPLAYITHIEHAWSMLNPNGIIVAIAPSGFAFKQDKRTKALRELVQLFGNWQDLAAGAFKDAGTLVNTLLLSMQKPAQATPPEDRKEHEPQSQDQEVTGELSPTSQVVSTQAMTPEPIKTTGADLEHQETIILATYRQDAKTRRHWLEFYNHLTEEQVAELHRDGWKWSRYRQQWHTNQRYAQPPKWATIENQEQCSYSEERADMYEHRSERHAQESSRAHRKVDEIASYIPMSQPIMIGHHSERRHRRDIDKIDRGMQKAIQEHDKAKYYHEKAEASERHLQYIERPDVIYRRIERLEADKRKMERSRLDWQPNSKEYERRLAILTEQIEANKAALEEAGGIVADHVNVEPGDLVLIDGSQAIIKKVNPKKYICELTHLRLANGEPWTMALDKSKLQRIIKKHNDREKQPQV